MNSVAPGSTTSTSQCPLRVRDGALREEGISDFVYDEEEDLFRLSDGRFAFSKEGVGGHGSPPEAKLLRMSTSSEECISIQPCSKVHGLSGRMRARFEAEQGSGT